MNIFILKKIYSLSGPIFNQVMTRCWDLIYTWAIPTILTNCWIGFPLVSLKCLIYIEMHSNNDVIFLKRLLKCTWLVQQQFTQYDFLFSAAAWIISLGLWPPWIYLWPIIEGRRTVPEIQCYIQFILTNQYITFGTAIAAFYVPVTVMCFLYFRIYRETKKRQKDLPNLQAMNKPHKWERRKQRRKSFPAAGGNCWCFNALCFRNF